MGIAGDRGQSGRRGSGNGCPARTSKPDWLALKIGKEKQLVPDYRTAESTAVPIIVIPGIRLEPLQDEIIINSVEVSVPKIFVSRAVKRIRAALDGCVELASRRMS